LSSTSSEQSHKTRSATESLASRYRHLFVLPSAPQLVLYGGLSSLFFAIMSQGTAGTIPFVLSFAAFVLSGAVIFATLKLLDKRTIANFRRALALLLGGEILWMILAVLGAAYGWASGSSPSYGNAVLFGAFACAGFEFLIINGAFEKNAPLSLALSAIHPASTLAVLRFSQLWSHFDIVAATSGVIMLGCLVAFPLLMKRRKTSLGHDALSLFQAFMKTWAAGDADELEGVIADHSVEVDVSSKLLRFRTQTGPVFLVLPGVHPGPFHPVGSYDLPGVISREFEGLGPAMTLHRPGGHERNLVTRAETASYARDLSELARSMGSNETEALMHGPVQRRIGNATVGTLAFAEDLVMTMSFAPLGSDDIDTRVEAALVGPASEFGFDLSVVDAHNSIDPHLQSPDTRDPAWRQLFEATRESPSGRINIAYSHSGEVGFTGRSDLTENGIGLFLVEGGSGKHVLILADANNSVPDLREVASKALARAGYTLIEFCTSDSHKLAAMGMTVERGYEALGESTPVASLADLVVRMTELAESRLAPAHYSSAKMSSRVRVFGSNALEEFAAITQSSSKFSRNYFRFTIAALVVLFAASMLF
jgi:putative membrane protein